MVSNIYYIQKNKTKNEIFENKNPKAGAQNSYFNQELLFKNRQDKFMKGKSDTQISKINQINKDLCVEANKLFSKTNLMEIEEKICKLDKFFTEGFKDLAKTLSHSKLKISDVDNSAIFQSESDKKLHNLNKGKNGDEILLKVQAYTKLASKLSCNLKRMEAYLNCIRNEFHELKNNKEINASIGNRNSRSSLARNQSNLRLKTLENQYSILLNQYNEKNNEYKIVSSRLTKLLKNCSNHEDALQNEILKNETENQVSEIEDYKILNGELKNQIDQYRNEYRKGK